MEGIRRVLLADTGEEFRLGFAAAVENEPDIQIIGQTGDGAELLRLTQGSVVALDGLAGEPLDILINGYLIAQGEVVVVADKYGVRITDIITPSERMRRLSR